jgi:hypothetical protein
MSFSSTRPPASYQLETVRSAHRIVLGNRNDLYRGIRALSNPLTWAPHHRLRHLRLQVHLPRLLHNYLAAARTYVDHARRVVAKHSGSSLSRDYRARIHDVIRPSVSVAFLHDLRNFTLHYAVPLTSVAITLWPNSERPPQGDLKL